MAHGHFIDRCECGIVISQCRCPDPAKTLTVVGPCAHKTEVPDICRVPYHEDKLHVAEENCSACHGKINAHTCGRLPCAFSLAPADYAKADNAADWKDAVVEDEVVAEIHSIPADLMEALTGPATDENAAPILASLPLRIAVNERYVGAGMMVGVCGLCCALIWPGADAAGKHVRSAHGGVMVDG